MKNKTNMIRRMFNNYKISGDTDEKILGKGGNAIVYRVENYEGKAFALKLLYKNSDSKKIKRFVDEIRLVTSIQSTEIGVIPIIEYCFDDSDKWYVMELAQPLRDRIVDNTDIILILECMISLSKTLANLHDMKIVHRDIKPSNLYYFNDYWCFSDFGLVDYPDKNDDTFTKIKEKIGNFSTIAPEMRRAGMVNDARPSDVFSMGKTLWMLLTNSNIGFEGCYSSKDTNVSLNNYNLNIPIEPIEALLQQATALNPKERITILEFHTKLINILEFIRDQEIIYSPKQLKELTKNRDFFYNTVNIEQDIDKLIRYIDLEIYSQENDFINKGLDLGIDALKYIKYKFERDENISFYVSPIHTWTRGAGHFPLIKIWVKYKQNTAKFVTNIIFYFDDKIEGEILDVDHRIQPIEFIEETETGKKINYDTINILVTYIKKCAYDARK